LPIDDYPAALALLQVLEREVDQLVTAQPAADEQAEDGAVT
jgi:hypothetical protein